MGYTAIDALGRIHALAFDSILTLLWGENTV
jgi:hypothetical protein